MWGFLTAVMQFLGLMAQQEAKSGLTPEGVKDAEDNAESMEQDKYEQQD
jgi:hypothetical protein